MRNSCLPAESSADLSFLAVCARLMEAPAPGLVEANGTPNEPRSIKEGAAGRSSQAAARGGRRAAAQPAQRHRQMCGIASLARTRGCQHPVRPATRCARSWPNGRRIYLLETRAPRASRDGPPAGSPFLGARRTRASPTPRDSAQGKRDSLPAAIPLLVGHLRIPTPGRHSRIVGVRHF